MSRPRLLLLLGVLTVMIGGCGENGIYSGKMILGGELRLPAGAEEAATVLLLDGSVTIPAGAVLRGDLFLVTGTVTVDGSVAGNLVQYGGTLRLGPEAFVSGDLSRAGGVLEGGDPADRVGGAVGEAAIEVPLSPGWRGRTPGRQLTVALLEVALLTLLALFLGRFFPLGLARVAGAAVDYPAVSGAMGLLVGLVGLALVVQMLFTVLLVPLSVLLVAGFFLAVGIGWSAVGYRLGGWATGRFGWRWSGALTAALGTALLISLLNLLRLLPPLGAAAGLLTGVVGLGAVFQTRFGLRRFRPATDHGLVGGRKEA